MQSNPLELLISGIVILAFIGFGVLFLLRPEAIMYSTNGMIVDNELLVRANTFVEYRQKLAEINIDVGFFNNQQFRNLRSERLFIPEQPTGKPQLFDSGFFPISF